jgi:hypothetical protein
VIGAILSFCSLDYRFLDACLKGIAPFAQKILISHCDHFFDGKEENYALLHHCYEMYPEISFIEYAFSEKNYYPFCSSSSHTERHFWHGLSRLIPFYFLNDSIDYILFLDADEIFDPKRSQAWFEKRSYSSYAALRFSSFYYFRESHFQAIEQPLAALLVNKKALHPHYIANLDEREGLFEKLSGKKERYVMGLDSLPLIHHYSYVRPLEEILTKVRSWAHFWERDWVSIFQGEYSHSFRGQDCVRGYRYREVKPFMNPLQSVFPEINKIRYSEHLKKLPSVPNVCRVEARDYLRYDIQWHLNHVD